jgi:hypothetical protein
MADVKWHLKGRNFSHCNCSYGCPCQFNALPTHGNCEAIVGIVIDEGNHGGTKLDGLMFAGVFSWPGPIHEGHCLHDRVCENKQTGFNVLPSCHCPPNGMVERCNCRLYGFLV